MEVLFYSLRHGRTLNNELDEYRGFLEIPLSDEGRQDAQEALDFFLKYKIPINYIVCSDLERTIETAKILAKGLGLREVTTDFNWRTIDVGEWEGEPKSEHPLNEYFEDKHKKIPGGDTIHQYETRQLKAIQEVLKLVEQGLNVLVITHGTNNGFLYGMMTKGAHEFAHYEGPVKPGGIMQITPESAIPIFKKKLDEDEKLNQWEVAYLPARLVAKAGTSCKTCWKFDPSGACVEVEGEIAPTKTCINYVQGEPAKHDAGPLVKIDKKIVGYGDGDTHCGSCQFFHGQDKCEKVRAFDGAENTEHIESGGCCDSWEGCGKNCSVEKVEHSSQDQ